jgi:hypothetical protein
MSRLHICTSARGNGSLSSASAGDGALIRETHTGITFISGAAQHVVTNDRGFGVSTERASIMHVHRDECT